MKMGAFSRTSIIPLTFSVFVVGLLGLTLVVSNLRNPLRPNQLQIETQLQSISGHGSSLHPSQRKEFLASRAALQATYRPYNVRSVVDALLRPPRSKDYTFREEAFSRKDVSTSLQFTRSLGGEVASTEDDSGEAPRIDPEGTGDREPDVWSMDDGEETTRTELEDILLVNLPLLIFFSVLFCAVEATAMLARRGRDWMIQTDLWKLSETAFRAQVL
jgi:hypothetical protein